MLMTLLYMFVTLVQSRQRSSLKAKLKKIFNERQYSVLFCTESQSELKKLDDGREYDGYNRSSRDLPIPLYDASISPSVCTNFTCAEIKDSLWSLEENKELSTLYPAQRCSLSNWKGISSDAASSLENNAKFKPSDKIKSEPPQHLLIQAALDSLDCSTPIDAPSINLQDYGKVEVWGTKKKCVYFILETDIDHMTDFFITMIQGQYRINSLKLIRALSIILVKRAVRSCKTTCPKNHNVFGGIYYNDMMLNRQYDQSISNLCKTEGKFSSPKEDTSSPPTKKTGFFSFLKKDDTSSQKDLPTSSKQYYPRTSEEEYISSSSSSSDDEDFPIKSSCSSNDSNGFTSDENKLFSSLLYKIRPKSPTKRLPNPLIRFNYMIMIYAEREQDIHDVKMMLENVLQNPYRYCVGVLTKEEAESGMWIETVGLLIVVGNLNASLIKKLVTSVTKGGKVLALCSNMLQTLLPVFKTAEVQENKLVTCSYDIYKNIDMVHDLFCYQASPVHARFSQENDDTRTSDLPETIELTDEYNDPHTFSITELGREETWHTPSILVLSLPEVYGTIVLSQIHLEKDPTLFANEKKSVTLLEKSNEARFNIIRDLFEKQFEMDLSHENVNYTTGYFLGLNEAKQNMMENLKDKLTEDGVIVMPKLKIQFCNTRESTVSASSAFLPILMYMCPDEFNTVSYYDNLKTKAIGRLAIFSGVLMSSMYAIGTKLEHGLAIITRQQTRGHGRHKYKTWLGPKGCAMFSVQVHIPRDSYLGSHITILQHIVTVAIITAVKDRPGYEKIPIQLKWPNDVFAYNLTKIGGVIITTQLEDSMYICNIGVGVNLDNNWPTKCINSVISKYNEEKEKRDNIGPGGPLKLLGYEEFIASVFNKLEILINDIQMANNLTYFRHLYQENWMHKDTMVSASINNLKSCRGKIVGIDEDGFLIIEKKNGARHTVHPDGNSFDSLKGLIFPRERKIIQ